MKIGKAMSAYLGVHSIYLWMLIFIITCAPRLTYIAPQESSSVTIADGEMERAALSWAKSSKISDVYGPGTGDSAHVAPLYPMFLGYIYRLTGPDTVNAKIFQQILTTTASSAAITLLPYIAVHLGLGRWSGILAAIVLAFSPAYLWVETSGSWEQPYTALALQSVLLVFLFFRRRQWLSKRAAVMGGILVGASCLLSASILPVVMLAMFSEAINKSRDLRPMISTVLLFTGIAALIILPWSYRNYRVLGGFVPIRSNWGLELAVGNNPSSNGRSPVAIATNEAKSVRIPSHPFSSKQERERLIQIGELRYMAEKENAATQWIAEHPLVFIKLTVRRLLLFWFPPSDFWPSDSPIRFLKSIIMTVAGICGLMGILRLFIMKNPFALILLSVLLGFSFPYMLTHVNLRYRYPVNWLIFLLAFDFLINAHIWCRLHGAYIYLRRRACCH